MTRVTQRRTRAPKGAGARTAAELLDAAQSLLVERGDSASVTVSEIVRRVGVTAPVLYAHFPDKDALFVAVHARHMQALGDAIREATRHAASPTDALEARGRAYIRFALDNPDAYAAVLMTRNGLVDDALNDAEARALTGFGDLVDNLQACVDDGSARLPDVDLAARVIWAQVHGLAALLITVPTIAAGIGPDALIDRLLQSIAASLL